MTRNNLLLLTLMAVLTSSVLGVDNYQKCLKCFHENRIGFFFCEPNAECYPDASWDCAEEDKIKDFVQCPQEIDNTRCGNYTFTKEDFEKEEPEVRAFTLNEGVGCWMQIDREFDGSYGIATIDYDNPYLLVFDEYDLEYEAGEGLGLVEEPTYIGWGPRTFFVANSGLMPTQFSVIWDSASLNFTIISSSIMALAVLFFS